MFIRIYSHQKENTVVGKCRFTVVCMEKDMQGMIITIVFFNSKDCHDGTVHLGTIS